MSDPKTWGDPDFNAATWGVSLRDDHWGKGKVTIDLRPMASEGQSEFLEPAEAIAMGRALIEAAILLSKSPPIVSVSGGRLLVIEDGCDWVDASYNVLLIPDGLDVAAIKAEWDRWYREEYCRTGSKHIGPMAYETIIDRIIAAGAVRVEPETVHRDCL